MISCFMTVKNCLSQGYPFVETIISALPVCEEFIILDAYSNDGTYEVLKKLSDIYTKINIVRMRDKNSSRYRKGGEVIAAAANTAKSLCKNKYVFYLQADEIIHEDSVECIKSITKFHPNVRLFHLPFYQFLFGDILYERGWRIRLTKNSKNIFALTDGTQLGFRQNYINNKIPKYRKGISYYKLLDPYASEFGIDRPMFLHVILPKPIFWYFIIYIVLSKT